jgi:hypothetical protein
MSGGSQVQSLVWPSFLSNTKFRPGMDLFTCLDLRERDYIVSEHAVSSRREMSKASFEIAILSFLLGGLCC